MLISENARALFAGRLKQVLHLIEHSGIEYEEIGIFGSYARGDCKTTSDIDFLVIVPERPDRCISGELREQANELSFSYRLYFSPGFFTLVICFTGLFTFPLLRNRSFTSWRSRE